MMIALVGALLVAILLLAKQWLSSKSENAELRSQIASLKRQLKGNGRTR
jgi:cell division protein FtsL